MVEVWAHLTTRFLWANVGLTLKLGFGSKISSKFGTSGLVGEVGNYD